MSQKSGKPRVVQKKQVSPIVTYIWKKALLFQVTVCVQRKRRHNFFKTRGLSLKLGRSLCQFVLEALTSQKSFFDHEQNLIIFETWDIPVTKKQNVSQSLFFCLIKVCNKAVDVLESIEIFFFHFNLVSQKSGKPRVVQKKQVSPIVAYIWKKALLFHGTAYKPRSRRHNFSKPADFHSNLADRSVSSFQKLLRIKRVFLIMSKI